MTRKIFILFLLILQLKSFSQSVDSSKNTQDIFSFKVGLIGGWLSYEKSVADNMTINSEIGFAGGFFKHNDEPFKYIFTTEFSVEPRYYYNFQQRINKNKTIVKNSANYISLDLNYVPDFLTIKNSDNIGVDRSVNIVPQWGLKRQISDHVGFEFALGVGYSINFENKNNLTTGLDLKFGFN